MAKSILTALIGLILAITVVVDCAFAQDQARKKSSKTKAVTVKQKSRPAVITPNKSVNTNNTAPAGTGVATGTAKPNSNPAATGNLNSSQSAPANPQTGAGSPTNMPEPGTADSTIEPSGEGLIQDPLQNQDNLTNPVNQKPGTGIFRKKQRLKRSDGAQTPEEGQEDKTPEDTNKEEDGTYFDGTTEDVLNPFDINSVKRHIHKLTAPEEHKASHHKKSHSKADASQKKPAPAPKPPSEVPFTSEWNDQHGRRVLAIIAFMVFSMFTAPPFTRKLVKFLTLGRESNEIIKRIRTTTQLFMKFALVVIMILGVLEILKEFGVDIGPMLTGAGIFGVALGFAGQNILKDLLAGMFLIIDEQLRVGDFVKVAGISGTVEEISLRKIILRDFSGNVLYVPNSRVDIVVNMTREFSRYVLDIPVSYKEDFNDVVKILGQVDEEIRQDEKFKKVITEPLTIYGISHFGTNGYTVTIRTTTKPGDQWMAAREYRKRIKEKFDQNDIEIPLSQLTIHSGNQRYGEANPISIDSLND